jgi:hypothetical protein
MEIVFLKDLSVLKRPSQKSLPSSRSTWRPFGRELRAERLSTGLFQREESFWGIHGGRFHFFPLCKRELRGILRLFKRLNCYVLLQKSNHSPPGSAILIFFPAFDHNIKNEKYSSQTDPQSQEDFGPLAPRSFPASGEESDDRQHHPQPF